MSATAPYSGPQCPRCETPLFASQLRTGDHICPSCTGGYEATVFEPPQRAVVRPELVVASPEEEASACAFHARNAAVKSCQRCGVFICALCDMNVGTGSYCPPCFDRVRTDGSLKAARRYRDYAMMARTAAFLSIPLMSMLGIPFGALTIYYAFKGRTQRINEGRSPVGMYVAMLFGAIGIAGQLGMIGWIVWAVANA